MRRTWDAIVISPTVDEQRYRPRGLVAFPLLLCDLVEYTFSSFPNGGFVAVNVKDMF